MADREDYKIGDWVMFAGNQGKEPVQIQEYNFASGIAFWDRISPLRLNKKWKEKLGFVFTSKDDFSGISYYEKEIKIGGLGTTIISIDSDGLVQVANKEDRTNWVSIAFVHYVHQLQNLL